MADLDIVNPYFRSSEYGGLLEEHGVRLIAPVFAGTTLDTPALPPELYSIFEPQTGRVFIDAGGDDAGVTALGGLHGQLEETGYQMLYVINRYRVLSQTPEEAAALLGEIEAASRLKATALVNNSHLGVETLLGGWLQDLLACPWDLPRGLKRIQRHRPAAAVLHSRPDFAHEPLKEPGLNPWSPEDLRDQACKASLVFMKFMSGSERAECPPLSFAPWGPGPQVGTRSCFRSRD